MSWQREVDEIRRREEMARLMGGPQNVARQHKANRLTVRERIDRLLDADTFHEIGALAGQASYDDAGELTSFIPSNFVVGTGRIDGRRVVVGGDDFTVRGGAADARVGDKMGYGERLALGMRMPMVRLVDGTGGARGIDLEGMPLDRLVGFDGKPLKDVSHEGARLFTREEIARILRAEVR